MMGNRITRCFSHGLAMNLAAPPRNPTISIVGGVKVNDGSDVKVYDQKRSVEYADYKPGMLYVSVYEVFPAETDAGLS